MTLPRPPASEAARLAALLRYEILDTPPEAEFDDMARVAALVCQAPVALISLVAGDRVWFKSHVGLDLQQLTDAAAPCRAAIQEEGIYIIPDATADSRYQNHPLFTGDRPLHFYAAVPLPSGDHLPIGTLCVLDDQPRTLSPEQQAMLGALARQIMTTLELRLSRKRLHSTIESISDAVLTLDHEFRYTYVNSHAEQLLGRSREEFIGQVMWDVCEMGYDGPFATQFRRAAEEQRLVRFEQFYPSASLWLDVRAYPSAEGLTIYFQDVTSRRARDEQLRLLETCVSRLNDIVLITEAEPIDEPGPRILYVNDAFVRRTGYSREEIMGRSPRFLQGPATQREVLDRIRAAMKKWQPVREELINYTKAGDPFWLEMDIVPVADATGWFTHWVAIERDISERKHAEAQLLLSHAQNQKHHEALVSLTRSAVRLGGDEVAALREIAETVSYALGVERVSFWRFDTGRTSIECQNLFEASTGSHTSGLVLKAESFPAYFAALEQNEVIAANDARADARTGEFAPTYLEPLGITSMLDAPVLVAGQLGGVLCIEHVGEPRQWTHGEQSLAISVTHLVSLALSQRALALSESRWRTIVESEPECVKIVSLDGKVLEMNPAGLRVIEADSLEQVLGRTVENLLHDEDLAAYQDLHLRACKGMTGQLEFRICGLRGAARWMETHSTPLRGADGAVSSVLSVTRDVTERKLAEQRLARLNRLYQMLSHTNEAIVRVAGRQGLYEAVCTIAVDHGRFRMAAIVGLDEDGSEVRPFAIAGEDAGYFSEISVVLTDTELNRGVIGTSLLTGRRDICNDFINDPRMVRWHAAAQRRGYCSTAAFPIMSDQRVAGALVLFSDEVDYFENDEVELLTAVADDISFAIDALNKEEKRKRAEAALRASEASMAEAQRIAHFGSWEMDLSHPAGIRAGSLVWSDEMYRIAGFEPGSVEVSNQLFFELAHRDDHEAIRRAVQDALRNRTTYSVIHRLHRPSGEERVVHETAQVFFEEPGGRPLKMVGTAHDITDQRRAEETLRESEQRFRQLAENIDEVFWITVPGGSEVLYVSPAYENVWGRTCESLYQSPIEWLDAVHPDDRSRIRHAAATRQETGDYDEVYRIVRSDDEVRWIRDRAYPVKNELGEVYRIVGTARDITSSKLADEKLLEQATLLDKAQDAILVRDLDHRIRYWNKGAERLYGWTAEEALGRLVTELLYRDPNVLRDASRLVVEKGEWMGELHQVNRDGLPLVVEARWTLLCDELGQARSILAINTDVTQRKQLEQQFLRAQRMESIGTLAGGIAHDLNNVLAPILMSIELLRLEETHPRRLGILSTIESSAKRGADMVRQVLSFAQGVAGQQVEVRLATLLREVVKITRETFPKNIEIVADIPVGLWSVTGDPTQLHQVLLNLGVNARDAMPSGGRLVLSAANQMLDEHYAGLNIEARPGPYLMIQVEDTGTGMSPEVLDRIFEPFYTTKDLGKGTGLGLSTTMAIVKGHGGFIRVYSEPGAGTTFKVYLPALQGEGAEGDVATEPELPRGSGELLLVVDDEAAVRQITQQTLEAFGYRVVVASDGAEATALYAERQSEIALVLTDMMMPLMDGPTTIQVLVRMNPKVRVIAASGLNANAMVARATNAGVRHFLPKPYSAELMLTLIRKVLSENSDDTGR